MDDFFPSCGIVVGRRNHGIDLHDGDGSEVRKSVTIDWNLREGARAKIRVMVKRILKKYGYPPDLEDQAVQTVLRQAELLCAGWV